MILRVLILLFFCLSLPHCATKKHLRYEKEEELAEIEDYEKQVQIKEIEEEPPPPAEPKVEPAPPAPAPTSNKNSTKKKVDQKAASTKKSEAAAKKKEKAKRMPPMEDAEGFDGRRPLVDPFRVGEKVTLDVTYFNIKAGEIDIMVKPFVEFNGKKAYSFEVDLKSYSLFSRIYSVDDQAKTYMDYETLRPHNLSITIKESNQLAETRTLFDWNTNKATYWRKKYSKEKGEEKKEINWDIKPYSQNVVSALFYLRTFQLRKGKKLAFRVADEGKNIVFTGEVIRQEVIDTPEGKLKTVVVKPTIQVDGAFKPMGDILIWLTDDDRKFVVKAESKIKIGTLIARLKKIEKGKE